MQPDGGARVVPGIGSWAPTRRPRRAGIALAPARVRCYLPGVRSPEEPGAVMAPVDEERAWLARLAQGDEAPLSLLYDRYANLLMAVAMRVLSDRREAEDLLHDVFLEVWRQAKTYDGTRGTVRAWLVMRMRSRAVDRVRAAGRAKVVLTAEAQSPDRVAEDADPSEAPDRAIVRRALAELPDEQRAVLELSYFGGMSSSEIATELDIPIGTVKSRVARGLSALRRGLNVESGGTP